MPDEAVQIGGDLGSDAATRAVTDALWDNVLADFEADKAHQAFLTHCRDAGVLPEAARRYREHKNTLNENQEAERENVDNRLSAVALLAMSQLDAQRSEPSKRGKLVLTVVAAVLALSTLLAAAMLNAL